MIGTFRFLSITKGSELQIGNLFGGHIGDERTPLGTAGDVVLGAVMINVAPAAQGDDAGDAVRVDAFM